MAEHGRPASIMTDRGSLSCASESEARKRGRTEFERRLDELGVGRILAGVGHPRTSGKLERFHGEIQRKIERFSGIDEFDQRHGRGTAATGPTTPRTRARRGRPPGRSRGRCPKRGKQSKTSTLGRCILLARLRNDFGIAQCSPVNSSVDRPARRFQPENSKKRAVWRAGEAPGVIAEVPAGRFGARRRNVPAGLSRDAAARSCVQNLHPGSSGSGDAARGIGAGARQNIPILPRSRGARQEGEEISACF